MTIERQPPLSDQSESIIGQFESTWRAAADNGFSFEPDVQLFSLAAPVREQSGVLLELIAVDLEMRWRYRRGQLRVESYLRRIPELSKDGIPLPLILEEYRSRCRWGDPPSRSEFIARFPWVQHLADELAAVDAELCLEEAYRAGEHDAFAPLSSHDYLLRRQLGVGGAARVYTAVQRSLDKVVAFKVLKKRWRDDPRTVERFLREARVAAQLRHPQIVDVHGLGRLPGGELFMVMDLIQGQSLRDMMQQGRKWTWTEATSIIRRVAEIVDAVHCQGFLHADITPGNILVDGDNVPYLTDFGMSVPRNAPLSSYGGTPHFAAPEQATADPLGPETDVYGLAATLAAMLTGPPEREGDSDGGASPSLPPWPLEAVAPAHRHVLEAALQQDRRQRIATARLLVAVIDSV